MAEELTMDIPPQEKRPSHKWRNIIIAAFCALIIITAIMSWWLANGRVSSVAASVDTMVYTIEPNYTGRLEKLYAKVGSIIRPGQLLARLEEQDNNRPDKKQAIPQNLADAQKAADAMASRVEQAREQEERMRNFWQQRVTEHVRFQLAMRSLDRRNLAAYEQAQREEAAARHRMEVAKEEFEQYSQLRAAMNAELQKMRQNIAIQRRGGLPPVLQNPEDKPKPTPGEIYSTINGRIMAVNVIPGQQVEKGQPLFLILPSLDASEDEYWIQAWFPQTDKGKIEPGQKVSIKAIKTNGHFTGRVISVNEEPQVIPNPDLQANSQSKREESKSSQNKYLPVQIAFEYPQDARTLGLGSKVECQIQTRYVPGMGLFD